MSHLPQAPGGHLLDDDRFIPIDDPEEPLTEAVLRELELDRAAEEGMIEPPGPAMDVAEPRIEPPGPGPRIEPPGPEDEPSGPGVEVPGTEVPGPEIEPADPTLEAPGRDDRPPIVSAISPRRLSQTAWRAA
jgi:hypothetical protein